MKTVFCNGTLDAESTWKTLVLIPKSGGGDFRVIDLVEVFWKAVTAS